jgi:hypothetical protein
MSTLMPDEAAEAKDARERRLAEALRENLRKRKDQFRRRSEGESGPRKLEAKSNDPHEIADKNTGNGRS